MTVGPGVDVPAAPAHEVDVLTELGELRAWTRSAEARAARPEHALASNRRIGMALAPLETQSQQRIVTLRRPAETVIFTGTS